MKLNETCNLVLNNLYLYDFSKCYPRLLENINWDFQNVDLENKKERNIHIGTLQKNKQYMYSFLSDSVDNLINYYLEANNIKEDEIIISQKDGFILKKLINNTSDFMELDFRGCIDGLIITPDRKKYLYWISEDVSVKGISNIYDKLYDVYNLFKKLMFYNKKTLFGQLNFIKKTIFEKTDKKFFIIEIDNKKLIQTNHGTVEIRNEKDFSLKNIDKEKYFNHYFKEFLDSIFLQFY